MICIMHQSAEYGYLKVNGEVILPEQLARMIGIQRVSTMRTILAQLLRSGVYATDHDGAIYCKRMIRDEEIRNARASGGSKGGNPALIKGAKDNLQGLVKVNLNANLPPTPSSSSSTTTTKSTSKTYSTDLENEKFDALKYLIGKGVLKQVASDWLKVRKAKRLAPTQTAFDQIQREADKAGLTMGQAIDRACKNGWAGFKASWDANQGNGGNHVISSRAATIQGVIGQPQPRSAVEFFGGRTFESSAVDSNCDDDPLRIGSNER